MKVGVEELEWMVEEEGIGKYVGLGQVGYKPGAVEVEPAGWPLSEFCEPNLCGI